MKNEFKRQCTFFSFHKKVQKEINTAWYTFYSYTLLFHVQQWKASRFINTFWMIKFRHGGKRDKTDNTIYTKSVVSFHTRLYAELRHCTISSTNPAVHLVNSALLEFRERYTATLHRKWNMTHNNIEIKMPSNSIRIVQTNTLISYNKIQQVSKCMHTWCHVAFCTTWLLSDEMLNNILTAL